MSIKSVFKNEDTGLLLISAFHVIVAALCFLILAMDLRLIHMGFIGVFSLITAYGVFTRCSWTVWVAVMLLSIATVFCTTMLYFLFEKEVISTMGFAAYLFLSWISTAYLASKRKSFES